MRCRSLLERWHHLSFQRVPTTLGAEGIDVGWLGPFSNGPCGVVELLCKTKGESSLSQGPANDPWVEPLNASAGSVLWVS